MNKRIITLLLALALLFSLLPTASLAARQTEAPEAPNILRVLYNSFSGKFSPFFSSTVYDQDVWAMTSQALLGTDREGAVVLHGIEGETRSFNGTDYTYTGIADCDIVRNGDGTVDYNFTLRDDIRFSDGEKMTADDVIFSMYVFSDPSYNGASTFYTLPIEGMEEYRANMRIIGDLIYEGGRDGHSEYYTGAMRDAWWGAFDLAGEDFINGILDLCRDYGANTIAEAMAMWGYELPADADAAQAWEAVLAYYDGDAHAANDYEKGNVDLFDAVSWHLENPAEFEKAVAVGESVPSITGIRKTGPYSLTLHMTEFSSTAVYSVGVAVSPLHYYGDAAQYDYGNDRFGFPKGDLRCIREKTDRPLGAGPFVFQSWENGVVRFVRNDYYYRGAPKLDELWFLEWGSGNLEELLNGNAEICNPSLSTWTVDFIKEQNGGELTGDMFTTSTTDNSGYGYIGINADTVRVGSDGASPASKALRKAFATVLSVYREDVIAEYYGERAEVIEYPISNTSWASPRPADPGYEIAFSRDAEGNPIYTDGMDSETKYDAALQAAIGWFKAAGYTWDLLRAALPPRLPGPNWSMSSSSLATA